MVNVTVNNPHERTDVDRLARDVERVLMDDLRFGPCKFTLAVRAV